MSVEHEYVLKGSHVTLEPLVPGHAEGLARAISPDDDVYTWLRLKPRTVDEMSAWIADRCADRPAGRALAFVQREPRTGALMGSTSVFDWVDKERCAEVGHTWLAAPFRRTGANTEAKLLLLTLCFETLGLARVQIVTDERNKRSRDAIERIGATFEGILRNHRRGFDGNLRNSAYHSIIDTEWQDRKERLIEKLRP